MDEDPVEILVDLASSGKIDPWNIDIVEVTDRFLDELEKRKELNLRVSGRTLFFASTLLRMKSETFVVDDYAEEDGFPEEDELDLSLEFYNENERVLEPIDRLEREFQRRIGRKYLRRRPVTLYELIKQLKTAEKEERRRQRQRKSPEPEIFFQADEVVALAHDEGYHAAVDTVYGIIKELGSEEKISLKSLCQKSGKSTYELYIPLLFLMLDGKVGLHQEEFFGDIYVCSNL